VRRWVGRIAAILFAVAGINSLAFVALSLAWGGDALNGRAIDGRF
jgi:hypothetical protein